MKKARNVILDFTSLLDIFMIILFFFILYGNLNINKKSQAIDEIKQQADISIKEAENKSLEAQNLIEQNKALTSELNDKINSLNQITSKSSSNSLGIYNFEQGNNIKIILKKQPEFEISIIKGDCFTENINLDKMKQDSLVNIFENNNLKSEDTYLCEFIYDGSVAGSNSAYEIVQTSFQELRKAYSNVYISETDLSRG